MTPAARAPALAYLVHGEDAGLVSQELSGLLAELVPAEEAGLSVVEEYGEPGRDEPLELGAVLNACRTPPFLADRRVVVVRDAKSLDAAQQKELAAYLAEPLDTTVLVLACVGRPPAAVLRAVSSAGAVRQAAPASNQRGRNQWVSEHLRDAGLHLDADATTMLTDHLGEDLARLEGIAATLAAALGTEALLRRGNVEPFLGEAGGVAPWELTDAITEGNRETSLIVLHRMMDGGEQHPLQILATLHRHYGALLRLDGSNVTDEAGAAAATGLAGYPARKALGESRRLGHARIAQAIEWLANADLDLRGRSGLPEQAVMEVLVARLAYLSRTQRHAPAPFVALSDPAHAGAVVGQRGRRLFVTASGRGPTIVLVHGVAGSHRIFDPLVPLLDDTFHVVRLDLLGYGHSDKPHARYTPDLHTSAIATALTAAGEAPPYLLVGLSMGVNLVLQLAARLPGDVRGLVGIGIPYFPDEEAALHGLSANVFTRLATARPALAKLVIPPAWRLGRSSAAFARRFSSIYTPEMARDALRNRYYAFRSTLLHCMVRYRVDEALRASADHPRLFVHGGEEPLRASVEVVRAALSPYPRSHLEVVVGGEHNAVVIDPATVARLVRSYAESSVGGASQ